MIEKYSHREDKKTLFKMKLSLNFLILDTQQKEIQKIQSRCL